MKKNSGGAGFSLTGEIFKAAFFTTLFSAMVIGGCTSNKQDPHNITTDVANKLTSNISFDVAYTEVPNTPKPTEHTDPSYPQLSEVVMPSDVEFGQSFQIELYTNYAGADVAGAIMYIPPSTGYVKIEGKLEAVQSSIPAGLGAGAGSRVMIFKATIAYDPSYGGKIPTLQFALYRLIPDGLEVGNYLGHDVNLPSSQDGGVSDAGTDSGSVDASTDAGQDAGVDAGEDSGTIDYAPASVNGKAIWFNEYESGTNNVWDFDGGMAHEGHQGLEADYTYTKNKASDTTITLDVGGMDRYFMTWTSITGGTCFEKFEDYPQYPCNFKMSEIYPWPTVSTIMPYNGYINTIVDISDLAGTNFRDGAEVFLKKDAQSDIIATNVSVSPSHITCTIDLNGKATGLWKVVVRNNDGKYSQEDVSFAIMNY